MKPLVLDDILDPESYARVRDEYRQRVIAHKKRRRISVGPQVSLVFEDRETLRYQVQEMVRVEGTTDPEKIQIEVDVYNELIPEAGELSATLFIEIPELDRIQPELDRLVGIDEHVALLVDGFEDAPVPARFDERQMEEDRISAVHYLRFRLPAEQVEAWRDGAGARLRIDHPHYGHEAVLDDEIRGSLARDLAGASPTLLEPGAMRRARDARRESVLETERVRAWRLPGPGASECVVIEPATAGVSLLTAEPEVLAEMLSVARHLAAELEARRGSRVRVRLDLLAAEPGQLRIELSART